MDLIKVMVKNDQQLVSAREVLEKVGLKKVLILQV